ncbi:MAG: ABC transporter permease [Clostridiales bacterium]|nr:ABC transporter permease [Clostridiales bacterium]MDY3746065.1 ABC transporter permease [Lachnospiraceae bacterium]
MKRKKLNWSILYLVIVLVITYLPIVMVVIFSFNESKLTVSWNGFSLKWYEALFKDKGIREALVNSLILGVISCGVSAVIGTLGALGMARVHYKSRGMIEYLSTVPIMVPEIILGMVFLAFFSLLKLPFGMVTLVIAHTAFCIPYIFMMVKARLVGIDKSLEEAALDLGAAPARAFFDITLPLITPAVISGCILAFAMSFDDVVISIFVNSPKVNTLPIKIYTQLKTGVTPEINALCTIILVVVILVLLISSVFSRKTEGKI